MTGHRNPWIDPTDNKPSYFRYDSIGHGLLPPFPGNTASGPQCNNLFASQLLFCIFLSSRIHYKKTPDNHSCNKINALITPDRIVKSDRLKNSFPNPFSAFQHYKQLF